MASTYPLYPDVECVGMGEYVELRFYDEELNSMVQLGHNTTVPCSPYRCELVVHCHCDVNPGGCRRHYGRNKVEEPQHTKSVASKKKKVPRKDC